ncbi:hypothetical protein PIB30_081314 [Stylosanthes scabra]|uniref:Uncharacterized protein n=1 Tax=Stylosanthes scabra TaxID=79078 RepID=A0ABU6XQ19_9FABA|nr:hypothetical protein [Stylosanthes scabra]
MYNKWKTELDVVYIVRRRLIGPCGEWVGPAAGAAGGSQGGHGAGSGGGGGGEASRSTTQMRWMMKSHPVSHICLLPLAPSIEFPLVLLRLLSDLPIEQCDLLPDVP